MTRKLSRTPDPALDALIGRWADEVLARDDGPFRGLQHVALPSRHAGESPGRPQRDDRSSKNAEHHDAKRDAKRSSVTALAGRECPGEPLLLVHEEGVDGSVEAFSLRKQLALEPAADDFRCHTRGLVVHELPQQLGVVAGRRLQSSQQAISFGSLEPAPQIVDSAGHIGFRLARTRPESTP